MKLLISFAIISLLSSLGAIAQGIDPVCNLTDFTFPPNVSLPELPQQFSALIEANLGQRLQTFTVREYFDEVGNRGRLETAIPTVIGTVEGIGIFDYDDAEIFLIPDRFGNETVECGVRLIAEPTAILNRTFGFQLVNGSVHIGSVLGFFGLVDGANPRYLGPEIARGIPCLRWQTCHVLDNNSYTLDYLFSAEDWMDAYSDGPVPVQIRLLGSRLDGNGQVLRINHTYNFVAFNSGPDSVPDEVFVVPNGLACRGRIPGIPLPVLPPYFSMYLENVRAETKESQIIREFYDLDQRLFRFDFFYNGRFGGEPGPATLIHDFNLDVQYFINRRLRSCSVSPINTTFGFDVEVGDDGLPQLKSPSDLFLLSNEFNYSYEGVSNVRGVDVDSWVSIRDFQRFSANSFLTDGLYEVFFTRPEWTVSTLNGNGNRDPVPWRLKVSGVFNFTVNGTTNVTDLTAVYDLFGFSVEEPSFDAFDTSVCFAPTEYHILTLAVPGNNSGVDLRQLRRNVRLAIADFADIPPLQIGNIQVLGENGTHIFVTLHIQNLTDIALIDNRKTANEILSSILMGLEPDGRLPFSFNLQSGSPITPFFFNVTDGCINTITEAESSSELTNAQIAGIAIGLFLLGLFVGLLLAVVIACIVKCCRSGNYSVKPGTYEKHKDDDIALE